MKIVKIEQSYFDARLPDFGDRQYRITYKLRGNAHHYAFVWAVDEIQAYKLAMPDMLKAEYEDVVRQYMAYSKEKQPSSMLKASKDLVKLHNKMEAIKEQINQWTGDSNNVIRIRV